MRDTWVGLGLAAIITLTGVAGEAAVIQSVGTGSAATSIDAAADFESTDALFDNPYLEGGLSFSRTNLSFNNNGCGFAGCPTVPTFAGFAGNYMYGTGLGGFFEIATTGSDVFSGLEFVVGTGSIFPTFFIWEASLNGTGVGGGTGSSTTNDVLGFADPAGFDLLRFTVSSFSDVNFFSSGNVPAFDTVRAQFVGAQQVHEPGSLALIALGLAFAGIARLRLMRASR